MLRVHDSLVEFAFLALLASGCGESAQIAGEIPAQTGLIALGPSSHDFGEVKQNTELHHNFVLTNNTEIPIRIVGMRSSCSCTWSESNNDFAGSIVAPHQNIDYPVFLNTGTYQDTANGKINIVYQYQSDDPKWAGEKNLTLEVNATILSDYRIEPLELRFGEINALESQTAKRSFRVTPVQMETLEIVDIRPSATWFLANIVSSGSEGYEIEVTFDGSSFGNSEKVFGHLIIDTNSKAVPHGMVSLMASYIAPIATDQSYIVITSDTEGTVEEQVRIASCVPSQIQEVNTGSTDLVHAEFDSALQADEHLIAFSIDPSREADIDETITVQVMLFPPGGEVVTQTVPVTIYRFHEGDLL